MRLREEREGGLGGRGPSSVAFTLDRYGHLYEADEAGIQDALDALLDAREARQIADSSRTGTVAYL